MNMLIRNLWKYFNWQLLLFTIMIFTPLIGSILSKDKKISSIEKRKLVQSPSFPNSLDALKKFPKQFENYYQDQFGFRDKLVFFHNLIKFRIGDSPSNNVVIGKKGWFFLKGRGRYSDPIGDYRNINTYTIEELRQFARVLVVKHSWLAAKGIKYLFIVAPNKHTIYSDMLPSYIQKINEKSALDQVIEYVQYNTNVPIVDLRKALIDNKYNKFSKLYCYTNTHWNSYGANFAQYEIAMAIAKLLPGKIAPFLYKPTDFIMSKRHVGDLTNFMGLHDLLELEEESPTLKIKPCQETIIGERGREPYTIICEGGGQLRAVVFRDSFFIALQPYFSKYSNRAKYILGRLTFPDLQEYVKSEKPDIVIEEIVERFLPVRTKIAPKHESIILAKLFANSNEILFDLSKMNIKDIVTNKDLEIVPLAEQSKTSLLHLKSTGKYPNMVFSNIGFSADGIYIVKISINSKNKTTLQLRCSKKHEKGYTFSRKNTVRHSLNQGDNDVYVFLSKKYPDNQLHIAPGFEKGVFIINELKIKKISNIDYLK